MKRIEITLRSIESENGSYAEAVLVIDGKEISIATDDDDDGKKVGLSGPWHLYDGEDEYIINIDE